MTDTADQSRVRVPKEAENKMIDRPHLLRAIERSVYLDPGHPLRGWTTEEVILKEDEFELYQWPDRSIVRLLDLAEDFPSDPYLRALAIALRVAPWNYGSPFPAGFLVDDVLTLTQRAADTAQDPLLEMLVANQARSLTSNVSATARFRFDSIAWALGCRLVDPDPIYVTFYLSEVWQFFNSYPRSYALSAKAVPPTRGLLQHIADLDDGVYVLLRQLLGIKGDLEILISDVATTPARAAHVERCWAVSKEISELAEVLTKDPQQPDPKDTYQVGIADLSSTCLDLAMTFLFLEQYHAGLGHLELAFHLADNEQGTEIVEFLRETTADLELTDA